LEGSFNGRERRRYPRVVINLPLVYQEKDDSCLRGGIVVNAGEGGFCIESPRDIPVGTELNVTVVFSKGFVSANFKAVAKIVWKGPSWKGDWKGNGYWEGYQYGLEFIQMSNTDRWKLNYLLGGRSESEENPPSQSYKLH
jgi:hypothetical protein